MPLEDLLQLSPEDDPISKALLESDVEGVVVTKSDLDALLIAQDDLRSIARVLDIARYILEPAEYFDSVQKVVHILRDAELEEFWPYFETRHNEIRILAEGAESIALLRICCSAVLRFNSTLNGGFVGRVFQFLAVTKGFAHPSRLNKRGKKQEILVSGKEDGPFKAFEKLAGVSKLTTKEAVQLGHQFLKKMQELRHHKPSGGVRFPGANYEWSELTMEMYSSLLTEAVFALGTYNADSEESRGLLTKIVDAIRALLPKTDSLVLDKRLLPSEKSWTRWKKERQCAKPETSQAAPLTETQKHAKFEREPMPELSGIIGNKVLTELLKVEYSLDKFAVSGSHSSEIEHLQTMVNSSSDKQQTENMKFQVLRLQELAQSVDQFASSPVAEHPALAEQEELAEQKIKDAASQPQKRSSSSSQLALENPSKRARLSYDDSARYGLRPDGPGPRPDGRSEGADPLPY